MWNKKPIQEKHRIIKIFVWFPKKDKKEEMAKKTNSKVVELNPTISVSVLSINGL